MQKPITKRPSSYLQYIVEKADFFIDLSLIFGIRNVKDGNPLRALHVIKIFAIRQTNKTNMKDIATR